MSFAGQFCTRRMRSLTPCSFAVDVLEGQIAPNGKQGSASQSIQMAPIDEGYNWHNTTPYITVWDDTLTTQSELASARASAFDSMCSALTCCLHPLAQTNGTVRSIRSLPR